MADRLSAMDRVTVLKKGIQINMVFFTLDMPDAFIAALPERMMARGICMNPIEAGEFRFVTHHGVTAQQAAEVCAALAAEIDRG
jgi:threonine aldolase